MSASELIRRLKAARIERVLVEVASKAHAEVVLQLKSGATAGGRVLDVRREGREGSVLLQVGEADDLTYVELSAIEALSIKNASRYYEALAFGAVEEAPLGPAPSALDLDALAYSTAVRFGGSLSVEIVWDTFEATETVRRSLAQVLKSVGSAIEQLSEDRSGREQLASILIIKLENGKSPSIVREADSLRVISALERGREGRVDSITLLTAIAATTED